jgi:sigma-E factor negative regulatory protein RseA
MAGTMMDDVFRTRELMSALADGQLQGDELAGAVQLATSDAEARATWHAYHLIGDVLRSEDLAATSTDADFVRRLTARIANETVAAPEADVRLVGDVQSVPQAQRPAANEAGFRWKLVAGVASVVAVTAVGWTMWDIQGAAEGGRMAAVSAPGAMRSAATAAAPQAVTQVQQQVNVAGTPQIMLRDPRLDELMSAHRQLGDASALQMPAGFLRNATFEAPAGR